VEAAAPHAALAAKACNELEETEAFRRDHEAPVWFEHPIFACLETVHNGTSRTHSLIFWWLSVAPFVASAGKFMNVIFGAN
jgi:hypothetical protein